MENKLSSLQELSAVNNWIFTLQDCDLAAIILSVKDKLFEDCASTSRLKFISSLPIIKGDPTLLNLLVREIIANSLKFSKISVSLKLVISSCICYRDEGKWIQINLSDNGRGFDKKFNGRVLKVDQVPSRHLNALITGSGLNLCNEIMAKHRGFIEAESGMNKGCTIKLFFPTNIIELF